MKIITGLAIIIQLFMGCGKADSRDVTINGIKVRLEKGDLSLYQEYEENFKPDFVMLTNVPKAVQESAKKYFQGKNHSILMGEDLNQDGMKEYFAVELYPGVHRGILSGVN